MSHPVTKTATIAASSTTSNALRVGARAIAGLLIPSAFTGTAITFTASDKFDGTFVPVYDSDGNQVSATVTASRAVALSGAEADAFAPWEFVKLVSNATEGTAREVLVICK